MAFTSKDANAAWKLTPEQEQKILGMTSVTEISEYVRACGVQNGVVQQLDGAAPGMLVDVTPPARTAASEVKSITINGQTFTGTQEVLDGFIREAVTKQQQQDQPARGSDGRFKKEKTREEQDLEAAERAELDLQFKRGQIDTAAYLEKTGAIAEALEKQLGIPLAQIQETFAEQAGKVYTQNWADATRKFLTSAEGTEWPGGDANQKKIGELIQTLTFEVDGKDVPLYELPDHTEAIALAARYMRENDLIVANENVEADLKKRIEAAKSPQEISDILGVGDRMLARNQSAMWGKS